MAICSNMREEVTAILEQDSAIKDGFAEYYDNGYDETKLTLEGEPTRWRVQRLTYDQRQTIHDMTSVPARREALIRFCLLGVTGYKLMRADGSEGDAPPIEHEDSAQYKRAIVKMDWMRRSGMTTDTMIELSGLAMLLSEGKIPFPKAS